MAIILANRWKRKMRKFGKNIEEILKRQMVNKFNLAALVIQNTCE